MLNQLGGPITDRPETRSNLLIKLNREGRERLPVIEDESQQKENDEEKERQ
ncbi:MAG: hypothetical protein ACJ73N_00570 [Bryobacteraceae bacterium]